MDFNGKGAKRLADEVQSGGEKKLSTAIFLMSIIGLSAGPLRVIDEMNQNLDDNNERKLMKIVIEQMTEPGSGQTFIITPRMQSQILDDVPEGDGALTVLHVFSGASSLDNSGWRKSTKKRARPQDLQKPQRSSKARRALQP